MKFNIYDVIGFTGKWVFILSLIMSPCAFAVKLFGAAFSWWWVTVPTAIVCGVVAIFLYAIKDFRM